MAILILKILMPMVLIEKFVTMYGVDCTPGSSATSDPRQWDTGTPRNSRYEIKVRLSTGFMLLVLTSPNMNSIKNRVLTFTALNYDLRIDAFLSFLNNEI